MSASFDYYFKEEIVLYKATTLAFYSLWFVFQQKPQKSFSRGCISFLTVVITKWRKK
jgi:hypothetical protein